MFTEETLRGGIAKQHLGSWDWSTKLSCVTRENNSLFIPVPVSFLLNCDDAKRNISVAKRYSCTAVKGLWKCLRGKYVEWRWNKKWKERTKSIFQLQGLEFPCLMQGGDLKSMEIFSPFQSIFNFHRSDKDNSTLNPSTECQRREEQHPTSLLSASDHPQ